MTDNYNKLPDTTEVENNDGTITRISFKYRNKEVIKTTTKLKLVRDTIKKSKRAIERNERLRNKKFGNAKGNCNDITFVDKNECKILTQSEWEKEDDTDIKENIKFKRSSYNSQGKGSYNSQGKGSYNSSREQGTYNYNCIRISNLSNNITENDLYDLASFFGQIERIVIPKDKITRKQKGYAFVNFSKKLSAKNALRDLNGHGYDNMILKVEYSKNLN